MTNNPKAHTKDETKKEKQKHDHGKESKDAKSKEADVAKSAEGKKAAMVSPSKEEEAPKTYHFSWHKLDKLEVDQMSDITISSVHTSDLSSFEESDLSDWDEEEEVGQRIRTAEGKPPTSI